MNLENSYDEKTKATAPEQDCIDKSNDNEIKGTKFKEFPFTIRLRIPEGFELNLSEINVTQHCGEVVITLAQIVPGTTPDPDRPRPPEQ